jgi:hypothetical protein
VLKLEILLPQLKLATDFYKEIETTFMKKFKAEYSTRWKKCGKTQNVM